MIGWGSRPVLLVVVVALAMLGTMATGAWAAAPTAYVVNDGDNTVTPIDVATNTPGTPIPVGTNPVEVAITPNGQTAYVTNASDNTVTPIDVATNTPGTPIPVGTNPGGVAITPNGQTAYVANIGDTTVTPIDVATNTPGTPIPVGTNPDGVAITPNGQTAYVANNGDNTVTPIDVATNTPGTPIPVGSFPYGVAITPNGQTAYVTNTGNTNAGNNTVTPIDVATNTPGAPIPVGNSPVGVAITPNGQTAYVANSGSDTVTPIDVATNTPGTLISVGTSPDGVAITPASPAPVNTTAPSISGTAQQGQTLTASHGSWTGNPTSYGYQWQDCDSQGNNCTNISGATGTSHTLTAADAGHTIRVQETASNAGGTSSPASSASTNVVPAPPTTTSAPPTSTTATTPTTTTPPSTEPAPVPSGCPRPTGLLSGQTLGPLALAMTRSHARQTLPRFNITMNKFDNFCLAGSWGIRAGYPSARLLRSLSKSTQATVSGRIVLALTANRYYALRGIHPGANPRAAAKTLHAGAAMHIGLNYWYMAPNGASTAVLKVRNGTVEEIGIANQALTATRAAQRRLLSSF